MNIPSLTDDFGALGAPNNDSSAFALAEAHASPIIYVPENSFISNNVFALHKTYVGPGTLADISGNLFPGNFSNQSIALSPVPQSGGRNNDQNYWLGDTSKSRQRASILGNVKKGLTQPYYCAQTTPEFEAFYNSAGSSGCTALVKTPINIGDVSCVLNSVDGINVGDILGFFNSASQATDTMTVNVVQTSPPAISFGGAAFTHAYSVGTQVCTTPRTNTPAKHSEVYTDGPGDSYAQIYRIIASYPPKDGQTHFFYTSTSGGIGGDVSATCDGTYLQTDEWVFSDNGYDTAVIGQVRDYNRLNNVGKWYGVWFNEFVQSYGTKPMDAAYVLAGKINCGIDFTGMDSSSNGNNAIGMATNHRIYWNNTISPNPTGMPNKLFGNVNGNTYDTYDGTQRITAVSGNQTLKVGSNFINVNGNIQIQGQQVLSHRVTGYGLPSGGVKIANFNAATATPSQTAQMLAQLISDLVLIHGLLGV